MKVKDVMRKLSSVNPDADFVIQDPRYGYTTNYHVSNIQEDEYYEATDGNIYFLSQTNLEELETKYQTDALDFVSIVIVQ